jgi:hypothetical protein
MGNIKQVLLIEIPRLLRSAAFYGEGDGIGQDGGGAVTVITSVLDLLLFFFFIHNS